MTTTRTLRKMMIRRTHPKMDRAMFQLVVAMGFYAAVRYCKNLDISFEDTYYMCFGRMPTKV